MKPHPIPAFVQWWSAFIACMEARQALEELRTDGPQVLIALQQAVAARTLAEQRLAALAR